MVKITSSRLKLWKTLRQLRPLIKGRTGYAIWVMCEVTITDGNVLFSIPGGQYNHHCETTGNARFTIKFLELYDIVKHHKGRKIEITVRQGYVKFGPVSVSANTCFFEDDKVLRSIDIPMNYTDVDILKLPSMGYTPEELEFNKVTPMVEAAKKRLDAKLGKAMKHLTLYDLDREKLRNFILNHIARQGRIEAKERLNKITDLCLKTDNPD